MSVTFNQRRDKMKRFLLIPIPVLMLTLNSNIAGAYTWDNRYGTELTVGYDDNYRLTSSNQVETASTNIGVFAALEGKTETSNIRFDLRANGQSFSDETIDDQLTYGLALDTARTGERFSAYLNALVQSESTTATELIDSGRNVDGNRLLISVTPGFSYQVNERNTVSMNLNALDVSYDTVLLTDYTNNSLSLSWSYGLDEKSNISANTSYSGYKPKGGDTTDINNVFIGYEFRASEATTYNFSTGYSKVERAGASDTNNNYAIDISHRTDERNTFSMAVSEGYAASGLGSVRIEDRLELSWNYGYSERSQFTLALEGVSTQEEISTDDREYFSIQIGTNYNYTRDINLSANYSYRERNEFLGTGDSSSVFFSLSYAPL